VVLLLSCPSRAAIVCTVRFFPILFSLAALFALAGCEAGLNGHSKHYRRVHVTNPRGELIGDWIAVGRVWRTEENGYRFRAVERISAPPNSEDVHYPDGRMVEVSGPNMVATPCGKPLWLYELEGE
jgi:hypothetical protein